MVLTQCMGALRCTLHFRCGSLTTDLFRAGVDQCPLLPR
jgi:hypothetical protein